MTQVVSHGRARRLRPQWHRTHARRPIEHLTGQSCSSRGEREAGTHIVKVAGFDRVLELCHPSRIAQLHSDHWHSRQLVDVVKQRKAPPALWQQPLGSWYPQHRIPFSGQDSARRLTTSCSKKQDHIMRQKARQHQPLFKKDS